MKHHRPTIAQPKKLTKRQLKPSGDGYIVFDSDVKRFDKTLKDKAKKEKIKEIKNWE